VRNLCARKPDEYRYPLKAYDQPPATPHIGSSTGGRERV
jgi:hypothetical protein